MMENPVAAQIEYMEAIWTGQRERSHSPRETTEVEAQLRALNADAEDEIQEAMRLQESARLSRRQPDGPQPSQE